MPRNAQLYLLVSISGASILSLEILGTRILGPYYGVSIFLWSALITVTLAALALGYALGGRWADRGPRMARIGVLMAIAGVWVLAIPWMRTPLLLITEPLGLRAAVLVASTILFGPPLTLLGMISPYVIRLKADDLESVGRTAGDLYAVSTVASVVAAVATGFWLIPLLGVSRLTILLGALLLLGASLSLLFDRMGSRRDRVAAAALLLAMLGSSALPEPGSALTEGLVYHGDSAYAEIRVLDRGSDRFLLIDGGVHSVQGFGTGEVQHRYVPVMDLGMSCFENPGRALLIGLGGGSVVRNYHEEGWRVDAVEIDPVVVDVAVEFFGLAPEHAGVFVQDGRLYLNDRDQRYDLVLMDAFGSSAIPFHLVTTEMFGLVRSRLRDGGVLLMNLESRSWDDPIVASLGATLRGHFEHVWALPTAEPPNTLGNVVLMAWDGREDILDESRIVRPQDALGDPYRHWYVVQMNHAWDNRFEPPAGGQVLTDDLNPVDLWAEEINRVARQDLREFFADDRRVW